MEGKKILKKSINFNNIIGKNIRLYRKRAGFSLNTLSKLIAISPQQLQKHETGKNRISADSLYKIATILNAPFPSFYMEDFECKKRESEIETLLKNYNRINSEKIKTHIIQTSKIFVELGG